MKDLYTKANKKNCNIHFVGIGGLGMSGIAEVLNNLGYTISGSDIDINDNTKRLSSLGCQIYYEHRKNNVIGAHNVVVSSAIDKNNPEIIKAKKLGIPIMLRAEMLANLMRFNFGIAVAGTHGKTTTTSLITSILTLNKLDPTYIIGGILNSSGINAKLGTSNYLVAEADESDASFLLLQPVLSVITNIDKEHMDAYQNNYKLLKDAFVKFSANLPFYGSCIICADDKGAASILDKINRPLITYGFAKNVDIQAKNIKQNNMQMHFTIVHKKYHKTFRVKLNLIGEHNILNALAAIGVALELDVKTSIIKKALEQFSGVSRRLDYQGELNISGKKVLLFDDYGHHPNEINAVFSALKNTYPNKRLVVIFQPHRYSRLYNLLHDFAKSLMLADVILLLKVYPASEKAIANINSNTLAKLINKNSQLNAIVVKQKKLLLKIIPTIIKDGDLILTLGAGDVYQVTNMLNNIYATK